MTDDQEGPFAEEARGELLQEYLNREFGPWALLVGCIMLNQTSRGHVDKVWPKFFQNWPNPDTFVQQMRLPGAIDDLKELIHPLGLKNVRAHRLIEMSKGYIKVMAKIEANEAEGREAARRNFDPMILFGCGMYAKHSWQIFIGKQRDVRPTDRVLQSYMQELPSFYGDD